MAPPVWATAEQTAFLESREDAYRKAKLAKLGYANFWSALYDDWFAKYPERRELYPNLAADAQLTPEQMTQLGTALQFRRQRLRSWYQWRNSPNKRNVEKTRTTALDGLMGPAKTRVPQVTEVYSKLCYKEKIQARVQALMDEEMPTETGRLQMIKDVTRDMWKAEEDESIKAAVAERLAEERAKVAAKNAEAESEKSYSPEEYLSAIRECPPMVTQFLKALAEKTGWAFTVLMGGPDPQDGGEIEVVSVHVGETPHGGTLGTSHPNFVKDFVNPYTQFLHLVFPESVRQARALPTKKSAGVGGDTGGELPLLSFDGEGVTVVGSTSIERPVVNSTHLAATHASSSNTNPLPFGLPGVSPIVGGLPLLAGASAEQESLREFTAMATVGAPPSDFPNTSIPQFSSMHLWTELNPNGPPLDPNQPLPQEEDWYSDQRLAAFLEAFSPMQDVYSQQVPGINLFPNNASIQAPSTFQTPPIGPSGLKPAAVDGSTDKGVVPVQPASLNIQPPSTFQTPPMVPPGLKPAAADGSTDKGVVPVQPASLEVVGAAVHSTRGGTITPVQPSNSAIIPDQPSSLDQPGAPGITGADVNGVRHTMVNLVQPNPQHLTPHLENTTTGPPGDPSNSPPPLQPGDPSCPSNASTEGPILPSPQMDNVNTPPPDALATRRSGRQLVPSLRAGRMNGIGTNDMAISKEVTVPVNDAGPPLWMQQARDHLTTRDLGVEWVACVDAWVKLEHLLEYGKISKGGIPVGEERPSEWAKWIAKGRYGLRPYQSTPVITDPEEFGHTVVKWWHAIQPAFRRSDDSSLKAIYECPDPETPEKGWTTLRKGGPSGMICVLTILVWWGQAVSLGSRWQDSTLPLWISTVVDVTRSLEVMGSTDVTMSRPGQKRRKGPNVSAEPSKQTKKRRA